MKQITIILFLFLLIPATIYSQRLETGDTITGFETLDVFNNTISISTNNESKIFLAFMRYAGCPVCNFRTNELVENYKNITSQGYRLIVIYESKPETLKKYLEENPVPFNVIGDPEGILYKKFGVKSSFFKTFGSVFNKKTKKARKKGTKDFGDHKYKRDGKLTRIPADFIISTNGIIEIAHYGKNIADHLTLNKIIKQK